MEIRQLRYVVTLSEELHFGRAAEREHIVQSALSQQLRRLERELGVTLFDRNTHRMDVTAAGSLFVTEARSILVHLDRAAEGARRAASIQPVLRIGFTEASYGRLPAVVDALVSEHQGLEVHQSLMGVPQQIEQLRRGRIDVGIGCARLVPPDIATSRFSLDPVGAFVGGHHPWSSVESVTVEQLRLATLLMADEEHAPEYNDFVLELCDRAGFAPSTQPGRVDGARAAMDVVTRHDVVYCAPRHIWPRSAELHWVAIDDLQPSGERSAVCYPQSVLSHGEARPTLVRAFERHASVLEGLPEAI
jgi:DNA-binding transcriptional LysR family regulator